jgi:ribonuclease Z
MSFSLTVLGSSSAVPTSKRNPTAHVMNIHEHFFLIDCGEGTQMQMIKYNVNLSKISHIFISHLHGDHLFGLFGLLSTYNLINRKNDLHIYAHPEIKHTIKYYEDNFGKNLGFDIIVHPFRAKISSLIFENKHITVETIPLRHRIPTVGFLFREKEKPRNIKKEAIEKYNIPIRDIVRIKKGDDYITGTGELIKNKDLTLPPYKIRSFAYCSDTLYTEKIIPLISGVDLLYLETTFLGKDQKLAKSTYHMTASQAAALAVKANAGRLLMGHFSARYKDESLLLKEAISIFRNADIVQEGVTYTIPSVRERIIK